MTSLLALVIGFPTLSGFLEGHECIKGVYQRGKKKEENSIGPPILSTPVILSMFGHGDAYMAVVISSFVHFFYTEQRECSLVAVPPLAIKRMWERGREPQEHVVFPITVQSALTVR